VRPPLIIPPPPDDEIQRRTGICLNMIVKNETRVIARLLRSVRPYIDYFVIVDTGSSDDTPGLIQRLAKDSGLPGEVHFRDWVNFGHNRQQALELAVAAGRGDWLLFIDADEELGCSNPQFYKELAPGVTYSIEKHHGSIRYAVPHLLDIRDNQWQWRGPAHNYLVHLKGPNQRARLSAVWILYHAGQGAKSHGVSQQEKYRRDARLFEEELAKDPADSRSRFYLAQSYRDAGEFLKAHLNYDRRVTMGGWAEEVYVAQCEKAKLAIQLQHPHKDILAEHLKAYGLRPSRAEALWQLAKYCRENKRYAEGYLFAKVGKDIPLPEDILFVRRSVYEWCLLDEFAVCAYWIGHYQESVEAGRQLLRRGGYSPADRQRLEANLAFSEAKAKAEG
jgi:glycosyltransferase involved in cell wall biosynthesis